MSHEQMLAWLDQANSGEVQSAADRLTVAAEEIRKIAEELKVRPQWVEWKGEGADAFRAWANDLANSTLRLGDFSEDAAKWLGEASGAIATAQASIPRDTKGAQANLDAATAAHNDPDSAAVRAKSATELAALKADQEKVRLEAASQMRKLGQSYELSASQLDGLERPKFPPPPDEIRPPVDDRSAEDLARPGSGTTQGVGTKSLSLSSGRTNGIGAATSSEHRDPVASGRTSNLPSSVSLPSHPLPSVDEPTTRVGIDSVAAPSEVRQPVTGPAGAQAAAARPDMGTLPPAPGPVPPVSRGLVRMPSASGGVEKSVGGGRIPAQPGQKSIGPAPARGVAGTSPSPGRSLPGPVSAVGQGASGQGPAVGRGGTPGSGITGGRPAAPAVGGRPMGRVPGGPVGGPTATGPGPSGRLPQTSAPGQPVARSVGPTAGRAASTPREGIVGGTPQRTGRPPVRPGTQLPMAPMRGGISGGMPTDGGARSGVRGAPNGSMRGPQQRNKKQKPKRRSEPPTDD
ncbi:translation initiation factor IF-2 [Streptomyces nodosus]|uniref:translation initiation factor IF-2 n=1 Tax=Streptomyces nodosus TaxID=40318 RepID=UPI0038097EC6